MVGGTCYPVSRFRELIYIALAQCWSFGMPVSETDHMDQEIYIRYRYRNRPRLRLRLISTYQIWT
jgi:hypothetical protein